MKSIYIVFGGFHRTLINETRIMVENERKLLQQMSSGCGTQQNDSKDEPTYAESLELQVFSYPMQPNDGDPQSFVLLPSSLKPENIHSSGEDDRPAIKRQTSTPTFGVSENLLHTSKSMQNKSDVGSVVNASGHTSPVSQCSRSERSATHNSLRIPRLPSDLSINSISNEHDDIFTHQNLRDELLNCDQKELFQFLNDDFDNSHNYFSDTVGYGTVATGPHMGSLSMIETKSEVNYKL